MLLGHKDGALSYTSVAMICFFFFIYIYITFCFSNPGLSDTDRETDLSAQYLTTQRLSAQYLTTRNQNPELS